MFRPRIRFFQQFRWRNALPLKRTRMQKGRNRNSSVPSRFTNEPFRGNQQPERFSKASVLKRPLLFQIKRQILNMPLIKDSLLLRTCLFFLNGKTVHLSGLLRKHKLNAIQIGASLEVALIGFKHKHPAMLLIHLKRPCSIFPAALFCRQYGQPFITKSIRQKRIRLIEYELHTIRALF